MAHCRIDSKPSAVTNGAWWALACNMSIMLVAGTIYGFGVWNPALKSAYGLDQEKLDLLAVAGHVGNYVVLDSGYLAMKFGTPFVMGLGCAYACVGYFALWLSIQVFPGEFPFWILFCSCVLYGHGCGTIDNGVMTQALSDFKDYKGSVNGCIKAYYGLATATIVMIYEACFTPNRATFLLFLSIYSLISGCFLVPAIWYTKGVVDESRKKVKRKFRLLSVGIFMFALYFFLVQLEKKHISQGWWRIILYTVVAGMLGLFLLPLSRAERYQRSVDGRPTQENARAPDSFPNAVVSLPRDVSGFMMLWEVDFWMFIVICIIGQGSGLMFIGNAAQILPAFSGQSMDGSQTAFVAAISVFNSIARLSFGMTSERLRGKVPRSFFLIAAIGFIFVGYSMLRVIGAAFVWPSALFIGFGYGGLWGVQPPMVGELFGTTDFSFKYSCSAFAAAIGSILFNELISGPIYSRNAKPRSEYPSCYSQTCFDSSVTIAAIALAPALVLAGILSVRTRWIYAEQSNTELRSDSEEDT